MSRALLSFSKEDPGEEKDQHADPRLDHKRGQSGLFFRDALLYLSVVHGKPCFFHRFLLQILARKHSWLAISE